jgi:hypothetical protein
MSQNPAPYTAESLETLIFTVRGKRVMLDRALAVLYGVETRPYDGEHCIPVS